MSDINYSKMLTDLVIRHTDLMKERNRCEVELSKLAQLIRATLNMLPDDRKAAAEGVLETMEPPPGLGQAVRMAFKAREDDWLTPPQVRDYLIQIGFDVSSYAGNPLASITTTIKRMVPSELVTKSENGQTFYRTKNLTREWITNAGITRLTISAVPAPPGSLSDFFNKKKEQQNEKKK